MLFSLIEKHTPESKKVHLLIDDMSIVFNNVRVQLTDQHHLERRILHTIKWCLKENKNHSFYHTVFIENEGNVYTPGFFDFNFFIKDASPHIEVSRHSGNLPPTFENITSDQFLNSMTDAVLVTEAEPFEDPGPRIIYCNRAYEKDSGYLFSEIFGKTPRILQGENTTSASKLNIRNGLQNWQRVQQTVVNYHRDGTPFQVELDINPVCDETGWWTHWVSVQRSLNKIHSDVDHQQKIRLISQSSGIGTWSYFLDSGELRWDDGMFPIYEIEKTTFQANFKAWKQAVHPDDLEEALEKLNQAVECGEKYECDFRIITPTDKIKYIRAVAEPVLCKNLKPYKYIGVNINVSREHSVKVQLDKQKSMLKERSRLNTIGSIAASVGHEINNPLSVITICSDHLKELMNYDALKPEILKTLLNRISDASDRISEISVALKQLTRNYEADTTATVFDILQEVQKSTALLKPLFEKQSVEVRVDIPTSAVNVRGSRSAFQQVLVNLLVNARDANINNKASYIDISVRTNNQYVFIDIVDEGKGIDDTIREKVFDPFFSTKSVDITTGLGLPISKSIIESMQGKLSLSNRQSIGTCCSIMLPICSTLHAENHLPNAHLQNDIDASTYNILVVEDDKLVADSIEMLFKSFGCKVDKCYCALDALKLKLDIYDLIISDLKMPRQNGEDFFKTINRRSNCRKVLITGDLTFDKVDNDEYWDELLFKPITTSKIKTLLNEIAENAM